jgi:hypothetical protein
MTKNSNTPDCKGCKKARQRENRSPRKLVKLPIEVTQHIRFRAKSRPLYLCEFCDGPALERAMTLHKSRMQSK